MSERVSVCWSENAFLAHQFLAEAADNVPSRIQRISDRSRTDKI